jgi:hypothetical protein
MRNGQKNAELACWASANAAYAVYVGWMMAHADCATKIMGHV